MLTFIGCKTSILNVQQIQGKKISGLLYHYNLLVKYQQEFIATELEEDKLNNSMESLERKVLAH